jgi:phosphoribosylanthranilate isomerase
MNTPQTKICGIRSSQSAFAAAKASSNYIGFNFVTASKRLIDANQAKTIIRALKNAHPEPNRPKVVGVFANQPLLYINSVAEYCDLDMVQLSGDEPFSFAQRVISPVIKAIKVDTEASKEAELNRLDQLSRLAKKMNLLVILDKYDRHLQGGTGHIHDWDLAAKLAEHHSFLLSGGLNLENIHEAIESVRPFGVDVASGVEMDGQDDATKITEFLSAVQSAKQNMER